MAQFDVTITETIAYTHRVEAKSGYEASAKAMLEFLNDSLPARKSERVGEPKLSKPVQVNNDNQKALPLEGEG